MELRHALDYLEGARNGEDDVDCSRERADPDAGPIGADQSFAEDADINVIMRRFARTGVLPLIDMPPLEGDFSNVPDFRTLMEMKRKADLSFAALEPTVRGRFLNDPRLFIEFVSNPENIDECVKMGLAVKKPEPVPEKVQKVEVVNAQPAGKT